MYIHLKQLSVCGEILNKKEKFTFFLICFFATKNLSKKKYKGGMKFELCDTLFTNQRRKTHSYEGKYNDSSMKEKDESTKLFFYTTI